MRRTRRDAMKLGAGALAGAGLIGVMPWRARAEGGDLYASDSGEIGIHPVSHASFVITAPGVTLYVDPVGDASLYEGMPAPDAILITHEHGDHYQPDTLTALPGEAPLLVNPAVSEMLPEGLAARATVLANGESGEIAGVPVEAIPAYNTTEDRLQFHPEGRDNGYILSLDGMTIYIAGDTEDIPEMRALSGIDIAFVPMNLPYTMDVTQAASAVAEFKPRVVYPYHYRGADLDEFERKLSEASDASKVVRGPWYS